MSYPRMPPQAASSSAAPSQLSAGPQPDNNLLRVFSSLFESGRYSDLVIKCQGQRWKAHRAVVCVQSKPLAAAIDGNFRESTTGEIDLEEDEPEIVGFMLEYFYTGNVSIDCTAGTATQNSIDLESGTNQSQRQSGTEQPTSSSSFGYLNAPAVGTFSSFNSSYNAPFMPGPSPPPSFAPRISSFMSLPSETFLDVPATPVIPPANPQNLVTLSAIYVTAEKYDVQPLKTLAKDKFEAILATGWNSEHFVDSLKLIYDGTPDTAEPDSLRELAINTAAIHAKELMDRGEFLSLCKERGDIATDILRASVHQPAAETNASPRPVCRVNASHMIYVVQSARSYNGAPSQRFKCAVCHVFID